ncbi:hypothetical protein GCM10022396_25650 [Flavivirga amylovorans]
MHINDITLIDLNKFTTSVNPVCLITLLNDPINKKLKVATISKKGNWIKNCFKSKFNVKLNLIKYAMKNVDKTIVKSIAKTSHFEAYF